MGGDGERGGTREREAGREGDGERGGAIGSEAMGSDGRRWGKGGGTRFPACRRYQSATSAPPWRSQSRSPACRCYQINACERLCLSGSESGHHSPMEPYRIPRSPTEPYGALLSPTEPYGDLRSSTQPYAAPRIGLRKAPCFVAQCSLGHRMAP